MIKNRNIAADAFIDPSKVAGFGCGEVFYVCNSADTAVKNWLGQRVPGDHLFVATSATADVKIQKALDATVANRNDYVVVMPSGTNYSITNTLTMSKKAVHLVCPAGISGNFPIGNTARLKAITAAMNIAAVSAEAVEIAGFYIKNYSDLASITLSATVSAMNIHHNAFMLVWTTTPLASIVGTGAGGAWGSIERNWFISETGRAVTAAIGAIDIKAGATGCRCCHNEVTIGDDNVASVGISNLAIKGHTDFNIFSESGGNGALNGSQVAGGTITKAIAVNVAGAAIGNIGAVGTAQMLTGGTTLHSYAENYGGYIANVGTTNGSVEA
jgi:hypothetical protein